MHQTTSERTPKVNKTSARKPGHGFRNFTTMVRIGILVGLLFGLLACHSELEELANLADQSLPEEVDFNNHIRPILSDRCFTCHGPDENQRKAGLRLDLEDSAFKELAEHKGHYALVPGNLKKSEVFQRIIAEDSVLLMPPPESNLMLSKYEQALIGKWIRQGAKYEPHWAFVQPQKKDLSDLEFGKKLLHPIDHFIETKANLAGLTLSNRADRLTLLRRTTLDLTGLPPTVEEIETYLADDRDDAYPRLLDRLMAKSAYGERMAMVWLDVARYADTHGYQDDGMRNTWPWREWVIQAYNENMPYDQFLIEQLAGDMLPGATRRQVLATCFNRNHPQSQEGGVVEEEYRVEYVADRTNTLGKGILGLTMECARCHDHKYDPISQEEYYSLFAYFNSNNDWGIVPYNGEATPTVMLPTPDQEAKLEELRGKIEMLEEGMADENFLDALETWLQKIDKPFTADRGIVAKFDFEEEFEVAKSSLDLDGKKPAGWAGLGKEGKTVAYRNLAKKKIDAAILGDKDSRPMLTEGLRGQALEFRGDCGVRFNRDMDYDRNQPFSVSLWIKILKVGEKGPIFNNTNGDFEGYRGWLCKLNEDGTLSFQLNHVWPDNSIDYQTTQPLVIDQWHHIVMTYDGSSKAAGLRFYVDGETPEHKLHSDNLQKSILHGVEGSNWSSFPLMLGKEKERTIKNVVMDEFLVYDRQLSEIEIQLLHHGQIDGEPTKEQLLDYFLLTGQNTEYQSLLTQITQLRDQENKIATDVLEVMVLKDRSEPRPTYILDRGMYDAPTVQVERGVPAVLASITEQQPSDRLGLAKWIVDPQNPLTARVQVNRLWMMLFGKGLVATQEDFGSQGNLPSHPELLDWLAVEFVEQGWDMKRLLKELMMSRTYQQSSIPSTEASQLDPSNNLYSHYPASRLSAETIRDNALASCGLLVKKIGGPSVYPYQPEGIWKALATRNATEYKVGSGEDLYRRSMYTVWKRSAPPPAMMNFDAPDRYYCVVSRQKTATPLQSLVLMNDPQFVEAARALAERSILSAPDAFEQQLKLIFLRLLGRPPAVYEADMMDDLYRAELQHFEDDPEGARQILSVGAYQHAKQLPVNQLAASTMVASTVMNFDEFVMKR